MTQPDLDTATPMVTQAAFQLGRHVSHPITLQYLQRNYHLIKPASLVLALTEEQVSLPTLQDKTAIVGTREEDKVVYPTLDALFQRSST